MLFAHSWRLFSGPCLFFPTTINQPNNFNLSCKSFFPWELLLCCLSLDSFHPIELSSPHNSARGMYCSPRGDLSNAKQSGIITSCVPHAIWVQYPKMLSAFSAAESHFDSVCDTTSSTSSLIIPYYISLHLLPPFLSLLNVILLIQGRFPNESKLFQVVSYLPKHWQYPPLPSG